METLGITYVICIGARSRSSWRASPKVFVETDFEGEYPDYAIEDYGTDYDDDEDEDDLDGEDEPAEPRPLDFRQGHLEASLPWTTNPLAQQEPPSDSKTEEWLDDI